MQRGDVYRNLRQYNKALQDYDTVIERNPRHAQAYFNRGLLHHNNNYPSGAIDDYSLAIDLGFPTADAFLNRARAYPYCNIMSVSKQLQDYSTAIQRFPLDPRAFIARAHLYYLKGTYQGIYVIKDRDRAQHLKQALEDSTAAIALDKNRPYAYFIHGACNSKMGNFDIAMTSLVQASALLTQPEHSHDHDNLDRLITQSIKDTIKGKEQQQRGAASATIIPERPPFPTLGPKDKAIEAELLQKLNLKQKQEGRTP